MVDETFYRVNLGKGGGGLGLVFLRDLVYYFVSVSVFVIMVMTVFLARGLFVFFSIDLSSSGYLVSRWWGLVSMSFSFSRWYCWCFSVYCGGESGAEFRVGFVFGF